MTANKSQGQSKKVVGINLTKDFFGHGQLYVAMSRVQNPHNLKIFKAPSDSRTQNYTKNVVYKAVLSNAPEVNRAAESTYHFDSDDEWMALTQLEPEDTEPIRVREEIFGPASEDEAEFQDFDEEVDFEDWIVIWQTALPSKLSITAIDLHATYATCSNK